MELFTRVPQAPTLGIALVKELVSVPLKKSISSGCPHMLTCRV